MAHRVVSVIIPTYNRLSYLKRCLSSLFSQDMDCRSFEVIVVDDGSSDGTLDYVLSLQKIKKGFNLRYFRQKNCGPAAARNLGARHSHGEFLAFLDDDCIAHKSWLLEIVRSFDRFPEASYIGGYTIPVHANGFLKNITDWKIEYGKKNHDKVDLILKRPEHIGSLVYTDNSAIRRSVFNKVKGFNAKFRSAASEDCDLCLNVLKNNYKVYKVYSMQVDHVQRETLMTLLEREYGFGRLIVTNYDDYYHGYTTIGVGRFFNMTFRSGLTSNLSRCFFTDIVLMIVLSFFWPIIILSIFLIKLLDRYLFEIRSIKATWSICLWDILSGLAYFIGNIVGSFNNRIIYISH